MAAAKKPTSVHARKADSFRLEFDIAATPERVAAIANFIGRVLKAADPALPDNAVTMVVSNFKMGAVVHPRTIEGEKATAKVLGVIDNPQKALARDPTSRAILHVFAKTDRVVKQAQVYRVGGRRKLADIETIVATAEELTAQDVNKTALRGTSVVYTRVYRVGRLNDDSKDKVRIKLDGDVYDIGLADGASTADFHRACERESVFPVHLFATWERDPSGKLRFDVEGTRVMRVDLQWAPMSGRAFVEGLDKAAPTGYVDEEDVNLRTNAILGA